MEGPVREEPALAGVRRRLGARPQSTFDFTFDGRVRSKGGMPHVGTLCVACALRTGTAVVVKRAPATAKTQRKIGEVRPNDLNHPGGQWGTRTQRRGQVVPCGHNLRMHTHSAHWA